MADLSNQNTGGGQYTGTVAAATAGVISVTGGRLCHIVVNSSGSVATPIYDNASAASGTVIYTVAASPTVGAVVVANMPVANGIYVGGTTNTSALTVSYTKDSPLGR